MKFYNTKQIVEAIMAKITVNHRGQGHACKRSRLLLYLQGYFPGLEDRQMRKVVEIAREKGVCSCENGYYLADTKAEAEEAIEYFDKKAMPLLVAKKNIRKAYPEFFSDGQQELF